MKFSLSLLALLLSISLCSAQTSGFSDITLLSGNPPAGAVIHDEFQLRRIAGNEDKPLRVSLSDDYALGTAEDTRGSVWMAAVVASMLTGKPLNGCELTVRFSGAAEGPSGGGCLCMHFVSALMRKEFPDDVVMTGTITPDGGIGPVGGVPYKIYAARKAGYKRVIIPAFSAMEKFKNPVTGKEEMVDCVQFGARQGMEIKTVETIGEAYAYLYETPLRREAAPVGKVAFSPAIASALRSDREALLQTLSAYTASPEHVKKLQAILKALGPESEQEFGGYLYASQSAADATLLSNSHYLAAQSIPRFMALAKAIEDKPPSSEEEASAMLKASIERMQERAKDVAQFRGAQSAFGSWPEIQLAQSLDDLIGIRELPESLIEAAKKNPDTKASALWFLSNYYEHLIDSYAGQAFPFSRTLAAVRGADGDGHRNLDDEAVGRLLVTLLTAARANAKTAETTGLQRAEENGLDASRVWAQRGKGYEAGLGYIESLSKEKGAGPQQRIRSCFMASEILADASADYIVFETVGIYQVAATKDAASGNSSD